MITNFYTIQYKQDDDEGYIFYICFNAIFESSSYQIALIWQNEFFYSDNISIYLYNAVIIIILIIKHMHSSIYLSFNLILIFNLKSSIAIKTEILINVLLRRYTCNSRCAFALQSLLYFSLSH